MLLFMQKEEHVKFVYFLAFTFLALAIFGGLGFYNSNNSITGAAFEVNPFEGFLDGFRGLFQNSEIMGYLLVFAAIFPIIYLLVLRVHIFQGGTNKWPGILVAASMTLISMIFVPSFTETIIGIFVYSTSLALLMVILLLAWVAYSLLHKQVSQNVGEFAGIASTRNTARASAVGAQTSLTNAQGPLFTAKSNLQNQKADLALMVKLREKSLKIDQEMRALNVLAVQKGKTNIKNVKDLFVSLYKDIKTFRASIGANNLNDDSNIYTVIYANLGKLRSLIEK